MKQHNEADEIHPGITWRQWLFKCTNVRVDRFGHGLVRLPRTMCKGGYCQRRRRQRPAEYMTSDGLKLCDDCAVLWAVRGFYKMPRALEDL